jgi:hypothetical protein
LTGTEKFKYAQMNFGGYSAAMGAGGISNLNTV